MDAYPLDGFLLAGGRSVRMGRDKARLEIEGEPFLARIARALAPHVLGVRVVGRATEGAAGGLADDGVGGYVDDLRPNLGPLAGIEAALVASRGAAVFVVACDLPLVSSDLLGLVASRAREAPGHVVVPLDADGRLAPLCAVYPAEARAMVSRMLDAGERRPRALIAEMPSITIPFSEYAHLERAPLLLRNVNTPEDYAFITSLH